MTRRNGSVGIFLLLALLAFPCLAQPALTFEPAPTVRGLTAGAKVAWIGLGRVSVDSGIVIRRFDGIDTDSDGDGVIALTIDGAVPLRSIWIAVDLANGALAVATPGEFSDSPADLGLALNADRTVEGLQVAIERVHGLWVRPGAAPAAWKYWGVDGSLGDADALPDGTILVEPSGLLPVTTSPAFDAGQPGDLVIAIDALSLGYQIETMLAPTAGAAR